jgi:hypothetical protein
MIFLTKNFDADCDESLEKVNRLDEIDFEIEQIFYNYLKDTT